MIDGPIGVKDLNLGHYRRFSNLHPDYTFVRMLDGSQIYSVWVDVAKGLAI